MNFIERWLLKRLCKKVKAFSIAETTIQDGYCIGMDNLIIVLKGDISQKPGKWPNRPGYAFFAGHLDETVPFIGS